MYNSNINNEKQKNYFPVNRARYYNNERVVLEESNELCEDSPSCVILSKYAIYGFNIIFIVFGVALLAMGTWLRTDSRFRDFLSERYRQVVNEAFWKASTLYTFSYIILIMGALLIVVAIFGCCGTIQTSRFLLGVYGFGVFVLLIFTISCITYIIYKKDGIDVELSDALNYMVQHYYQGAGVVQESLDHLQQAFRCCGNAGCSDFRAFRQDPPRSCDLRCDGCHYRIWLALRIGFSVALVVFAIIILAQLVAIAVSMALVFHHNENRRNYVPRNPAYYHNSAYQQSQTLPRKHIKPNTYNYNQPPPILNY